MRCRLEKECPVRGKLLLRLFCPVLLLLAPLTGCGLMRTASKVPGEAAKAVTPGKKSGKAADPVEVQDNLLRFTDAFTMRTILGIERLRHGTNEVNAAEVLQWKIAFTSETTSIASGPNAIANLLDMTVFVTVMRMALEEHWQPNIFGESAASMLDSCRNAEAEIWQMTKGVLKPEQEKELHEAIAQWRQQNRLPENVLAARAVGFAAQVVKANQADATKTSSVFDLLSLDPLAGLDPAVREIAQTRLFAERALYAAQKMPLIIRWQTELLSINTLQTPSVQQLVTNSTLLTSSAERFAGVAEKLPGQVSAEREQIVKALEAQEKTLTPLLTEMRQTLTAGSQMSTSLNTTLTTFDALMKRFGIGETNSTGPPDTNSEPFRILDYAKTAAQLELTARQLTELLNRFDQTIGSTNLMQLSAQAQNDGKQIVDYAFWKAVLFVVVVLVALLVYRFISVRIMARARSKVN
jgi:hypothetical protein